MSFNYDFQPIMEEAGSFYCRYGSIRVQIGYREHVVRKNGSVESLKVPEFLRMEQHSGAPVDVPMSQLEAFLGLVNGASRELKHRRRLILHDMARLGVRLSGGNG